MATVLPACSFGTSVLHTIGVSPTFGLHSWYAITSPLWFRHVVEVAEPDRLLRILPAVKHEFNRGICAFTIVALPTTLKSMGNGSVAGFSTIASTRTSAITGRGGSPEGILVEGTANPGANGPQLVSFGLSGAPVASTPLQFGVAPCRFCVPGGTGGPPVVICALAEAPNDATPKNSAVATIHL